MAGQTGLLNPHDSGLSHMKSFDLAGNPESGFDCNLLDCNLFACNLFGPNVYARIVELAKVRGLDPQQLISEIVINHLSNLDQLTNFEVFENNNENKAKHVSHNAASHNAMKGFPKRFVDPADQVSLEEDFKDLISN